MSSSTEVVIKNSSMDEELQLSDIPINDRIVMDTGCNLSFLLRFIHEGYVKDLKYDYY